MATVFVAGSMNIKRLDDRFVERLQNTVTATPAIVVGDADGADTSIQELLLDAGAESVTVYCSGEHPRNNVGNWPICKVQTKAKAGTRAYFTAKDLEMARVADRGLMIWDAKSTGTLSNVIELVKREKKCDIYVNKDRAFLTICDVEGLDRLVSRMSDSARSSAESKIGLSRLLADLVNEQFSTQS
jgi:hypothetical protein